MSPEALLNASTNVSAELELEELELFGHDGSKVVALVVLILMVSFVIGNCLHRFNISWLPESLVLVLLGGVVGLIMPMGRTEWSGWMMHHISIHQESIFNEMLLNYILLPIIIFEAGWSLNHRDFLSQFPYILLFAIFGTLISMMVVGSLILATSSMHGIHNARVAFAYAALISAVDPVATLSTYQHLAVQPLLNTIVFGESVINDAVAIVLFKTLNDLPAEEYEHMTGGAMAGVLSLGVLKLLVFSLGLGLALGVIYVLTIRFTELGHSTSLSTMFIFFSCFFTYNIAEVLSQSGIIAVLFCGMLMGGYASPHLSRESTMMTSFLLKQISSVADMMVFLFVGLAAVYTSMNGLQLGCWIMLFCLLGRAVATIPIGALTNVLKSQVHKNRPEESRHMLSWKHIFMMWHAGLRGGIALVLTLSLGDWVDEVNGVGSKDALRNATLVVICAFLAVFGGTTEMCLRMLGIPMGGASQMDHHEGQVMDFTRTLTMKVVVPALVGKNKSTAEEEVGNVVSEVLDEARRESSMASISSRVSKDSGRHWSERYAMFGTYDPTHANEVGAARAANMQLKPCAPALDESSSV